MFVSPRKSISIYIAFVLAPTAFGQLDGLPIKMQGRLNGILTAKGAAWIEVKDDEGYPHRYLPAWIGDSPARGGGFDPSILRELDAIAVGNRVELTWHWDGHLRVDRLKLLRPSRKKGVANGWVLEKGDKWVDVSSSKHGSPVRYYARWVGGAPDHGGSYHEPTLAFLEELEPADRVKLTWIYDVRPRILSLGMGDDAEEENVFVPFYEKRNLLRPQLPPSMRTNPFDSVSPSSPTNAFDRGATNPFDHVSPNASPVPAVTPFDAAPAPPGPAGNPFDAAPAIAPMHANPFSPNIPGSPFDAQPQSPPAPDNPFDQ